MKQITKAFRKRLFIYVLIDTDECIANVHANPCAKIKKNKQNGAKWENYFLETKIIACLLKMGA